MTKSPFLPSNSATCPRNGPKKAKNGTDCAHFVSTSPKTENGPYLGLRGSNLDSEGTWSTRNLAKGQPGPRTVGANGGSTKVPGAKKKHFFQSCSYTTWDAQTSDFSPF